VIWLSKTWVIKLLELKINIIFLVHRKITLAFTKFYIKFMERTMCRPTFCVGVSDFRMEGKMLQKKCDNFNS
jgi:hypothetical protein